MYGETAAGRAAGLLRDGLSPHVRGNPAPRRPHRRPRGSIPHVRGNLSSNRPGARCLRSIPACTGKPTDRSPGSTPPRVYPRMYGETLGAHFAGCQVYGLSPHVRGNRSADRAAGRRPGSIPACTGKPTAGAWSRYEPEVYPRMYGETGPSARSAAVTRGLSPHVRGNLSASARLATAAGSIPACTGKPVSGVG